jgi:hypothetical protein
LATDPISEYLIGWRTDDLNGTQGPFYFAIDSNNPDDRYFLRAYDKDGVLMWSQDNFPTEDDVILPENTIGLSNLVVNNGFLEKHRDFINSRWICIFTFSTKRS